MLAGMRNTVPGSPVRHFLRSWAARLSTPTHPGPDAPAHPRTPRPRLSPRAADLLLTAFVLALSVWQSRANPYLGPVSPWGNTVLAVCSALPLLARRRFPELVVLAALIAQQTHTASFVVPFAYYAEGAYRRGPHARRAVWATAVAGLVGALPWNAETWSHPSMLANWFLVNFVLVVVVPLLLGLYTGERRAVVEGLVERAERAEREQRLIAEAARSQERQRIAGEMHDVVSHQVSLIVVHANALTAVAHDPGVTAEAAATIRTAGRRALMELREMVGVLRSDEAAPDRKPASADGDAPSGSVADRVTALADSSRAAGLPVTVHIAPTPPPRSLPEPVERAAYRVVQEALTNVHKHAPGAATDIRLAATPGSLRVSVRNGPAPRTADADPDGSGPLLPSGGHGLIGLTERVRLAGGTLVTGPGDTGGFQVEATFPLTPAEA